MPEEHRDLAVPYEGEINPSKAGELLRTLGLQVIDLATSDRPVRPHRLWTWAKISKRFKLGQVTRPGIDEGKLTSLLVCPTPVRRKLLPLLPTVSHARLIAVVAVHCLEWQEKLGELRDGSYPQMATSAAAMALSLQATLPVIL